MRRPREPSLLYPKKTKNPNPSPIGNRFGFFLFGGRGWIARAAHLKKPRRGFFPAGLFGGSMLFESTLASPFSKLIKQKLRYPLDTGVLGGRGWIRTTEAESSRFTVCPHWPLGNTPIFNSQSHRLPVYITTGARVCQCFLRKFSCRGRK